MRMKIIFLNTWNGKLKEGISDFITEQSATADVFCFQEVYDSSKVLFESLLPSFKSLYAHKAIDNDDFPQAMYIKKDLEVRSSRTLLNDIPEVGLGLYIEIKCQTGNIHICNVHGMAFPGDKLDNAKRLEQSRALIDFFRSLPGRKLIGGDFNILPDTESIRMFERNGYVDMIKKHNIQTTRNHFAWEKYPDSKQYYSDYAFVSPDVNVKDFVVPRNEVSDHLPLILDIET